MRRTGSLGLGANENRIIGHKAGYRLVARTGYQGEKDKMPKSEMRGYCEVA